MTPAADARGRVMDALHDAVKRCPLGAATLYPDLGNHDARRVVDALVLAFTDEARQSLAREPRSNSEVLEQTNDLARQFYARRGYVVPGGYRFQDATHPHEVEAWDMAVLAMEVLTDTDAQGAAHDED